MQILSVCICKLFPIALKRQSSYAKNALQKFGNCYFPNFRLFEQVDKLIKITFNQKRTHTV